MYEDKVIEVLRNIEAEQKKPDGVRFDMETWFDTVVVVVARSTDCVNVCRTTACFAGHALINEGYGMDTKNDRFYHPVTGDRIDVVNVQFEAAEVLGIEDYQAEELFYLGDLYDVYDWLARHMGIDVQVLCDKVTG